MYQSRNAATSDSPLHPSPGLAAMHGAASAPPAAAPAHLLPTAVGTQSPQLMWEPEAAQYKQMLGAENPKPKKICRPGWEWGDPLQEQGDLFLPHFWWFWSSESPCSHTVKSIWNIRESLCIKLKWILLASQPPHRPAKGSCFLCSTISVPFGLSAHVLHGNQACIRFPWKSKLRCSGLFYSIFLNPNRKTGLYT